MQPKKASAKAPAAGIANQEQPKAKAKTVRSRPQDEVRHHETQAKALSLDDEEEPANFATNSAVARQLAIDPGFSNRELMEQVESQLAQGEELHWAGRPSLEIAKKTGLLIRISGILFTLIGIGMAVGILLSKAPALALFVPAFIIVCSMIAIAIGPKTKIRQAEQGWYAVTDQRAIVFLANLWGKGGQTTTYTQAEAANMWIKKSWFLPDAGSLVFRSEVVVETTHHTKRRVGPRRHHGPIPRAINNTRTTTTTRVTHYGFLDIEQVSKVEILVRAVLLIDGKLITKVQEDDEPVSEDE